MSPALASIFAGGLVGAYTPTLRDQIRAGRIEVPFGTINPITVRRDEHPWAFALCAVAMVGFVAVLLAFCLFFIARALLS